MEQDSAWRDRLLGAIEEDGRSDRSISLAAGVGAGFIHDLRKNGKQPTVPKLISLCKVLNKSLAYVFLGINVTPQQEELLRLFLAMDEGQRAALEGFLRTLQTEPEQTLLPAPSDPMASD